MNARLPRPWRTLILLAAALALGAVLYFRQADPSAPVDFRGRLLDADGQPLGRVALRFHAQGNASNRMSLLSLTQADGTFVGRALPGSYRVTLVVPPGREKEVNVPERYRDITQTPWQVSLPTRWPWRLVLRVEEE